MGNRPQVALTLKALWIAVFAFFAVLFGAGEASTASAQTLPACRDNELLMTGDFGSVRFTVEVARTPEEQSEGLMFREEMAASAGMLFVYNDMHERYFWMKNTLIPLDMIFIDDRGAVVHVHPEAIPLDETTISSQVPARFVLEINGGLAARIGIAPGAVIRHPAVPERRALLPCE